MRKFTLGWFASALALAGCVATAPPVERRLYDAAERGSLEDVRAALDAGSPVDESRYGYSALAIAAYGGHAKVVDLLLERGARLEGPDENSQTPLAFAAQGGRTAIIKTLVAKGADIEAAISRLQDCVNRNAPFATAANPANVLSMNTCQAGIKRLESLQQSAPGPQSAQGLSASDVERIARAVQGAAKPAAAETAASALPPSPAPRFSLPERPDDVAVVIGIESYSELPKAAYAERDAAAFKAHVRALGVPERNIAYLAGPKASKSALIKNLEVWLPAMVKPDSRVYVYFSGHGAPDVKSGLAYLVPWDGDASFLEATAYPVKTLYAKLRALPARQVLVAMDACFTGAGGRSVIASGARPLVVKVETGGVGGNVTALTSSAADEISGSLDAQGHGAFTYYLLQGLDGAAKDGSGRVTAKSLLDYLTPKVKDEARRLNRDQTPQLLGADLVLR